MSTALTIDDKPSHDEIIRVLENSLYPGAKRESIELVLAYCRANGLDPMLRPVYIVPTSVKKPDGQWETRDVLMPGIADYRIKAARSGEYGGKSEPEFGPDVREKLSDVLVTYPAWCRMTVRRIVQGQPREFTATERWVENYATAGRNTTAPNTMWKKRPYGQLAKVAEAQALRMAFPEFSSGYTMEEMQGKTVHDDFTGTTLDAEDEAPVAPIRDARVAERAPAYEAQRKMMDNYDRGEQQRKREAREDEAPPKHAASAARQSTRAQGDVFDQHNIAIELLDVGDSRTWMSNLEMLLAEATSLTAVEVIGECESVKRTIEKAPGSVRARVSELLANACKRFIENDPAHGEELPEVEIEGADKVMSG